MATIIPVKPETYKVKQADSLWVDYVCANWSEINNAWPDWTGIWTVTKTTLGEILASGNLIQSAVEGTFQLRIPVSEGTSWDTIPEGIYHLNFQIECPSVVFKFEDTDRLIIVAQEILDVS